MTEQRRTSNNRVLRKQRIRSRVHGTAERPRLTITISNRHVQAQVINDDEHKTLAASSTVGRKASGSLNDFAVWVGTDIAKKAVKTKIKRVVLDRNGKPYHGRVAALADAARKEGLEF